MTEKSNDLSDKDKVTPASSHEEAKSIENEQNLDASEAEDSPVGDGPDSKGDDTSIPESEAITDSHAEKSQGEIDLQGGDGQPEPTEVESQEDRSDMSTAVEEDINEAEGSASSVDTEAGSDEAGMDEDSTGEEEDHHEEHVDLTGLSKVQLVKVLKDKLHAANVLKIDKLVHEIKAAFDELTSKEKDEARTKFKSEGGEDDDFDFRPSEEEKEFNRYYQDYRHQLTSVRKEAERQKEKNLLDKSALLDKLRELVDGEETTLSMSTIKGIQEEWKAIGPVPSAQNRSLWASYNALMDRFYDNRSIYFELKELDRKKNLESKMELCEKAEALKDVKDLKDSIKSLNELHEEFKHIGPVPRDEQEALWQRFKAASDAVYDRRKDFYEGQKEVFKKNQDDKEALIASLKPFADFKADRIKDWNTKTKEILDIQKAWEKIGPVPREVGKEINKSFWASFKQFFHNKNLFFKELDEVRAGNQAKAEELIVKAEELKDNTDWQNTANALVKLQQDWKKLGPTPEKSRDSLYKRFKAACDMFFENRRNSNKQSNSEFESNLKKKQEICEQIIADSKGEEVNEDKLIARIAEFNEVGFVPRKNMKEMQVQFKSAVDTYLEKLDVEGSDKEDFLFRLNLNKLQSDPNAAKTLNKKEHGIRKQISELENNITLWKNNLEFFAASKTADKLKDQFDIKIQKAEEEIDKLKKKLSILREF